MLRPVVRVLSLLGFSSPLWVLAAPVRAERWRGTGSEPGTRSVYVEDSRGASTPPRHPLAVGFPLTGRTGAGLDVVQDVGRCSWPGSWRSRPGVASVGMGPVWAETEAGRRQEATARAASARARPKGGCLDTQYS